MQNSELRYIEVQKSNKILVEMIVCGNIQLEHSEAHIYALGYMHGRIWGWEGKIADRENRTEWIDGG